MLLMTYKEKRQIYLDLLGNKCIICGTSERLEFDHVDPNKRNFRLGGKLWSYKESRILEELKLCQLLCYDHHWEKTRLEFKARFPIKHGTPGGYSNRKCKCDLCKKAWREYRYAKDYHWHKEQKRYIKNENIYKQSG